MTELETTMAQRIEEEAAQRTQVTRELEQLKAFQSTAPNPDVGMTAPHVAAANPRKRKTQDPEMVARRVALSKKTRAEKKAKLDDYDNMKERYKELFDASQWFYKTAIKLDDTTSEKWKRRCARM